MHLADDQIYELKHAYQVLGLPHSATQASIKNAYHRLVKRWHPDLYPNGTRAQAEATHMMKLINEAYSRIGDAPLRDYREGFQERRQQRAPAGNPRTANKPAIVYDARDWESALVSGRLDYWVRFGFGAFFGIFVSFFLVVRLLDHPAWLILASMAVILGCGFGSARYDERFWNIVFRWWWW